MGEVIRLAERRGARRPAPRQRRIRVEFLFDLACPFTYLAAERVERAFTDVTWTPASNTALRAGSLASDEVALAGVRAAAEERARELRLPLVWPESWPADVPAAMRVAAYAAECGRGAAFVLAAGRLAYCGGFDLDDPEILAEAAAAAGLGLDGCLRAAGERRRDVAIEGGGRRLLAVGADRLPALRVGRSLYWGEGQVATAAAAARIQAAAGFSYGAPPNGSFRVERYPVGHPLVGSDEPGEDLLVELLARLLTVRRAPGDEERLFAIGLSEQQLEVCVADLVDVLHACRP